MTAYYNEWDKPTAAWLRELIKRDLIAPGDVDERSIKDVQADDLKGYDQVHLFAGIGGWSQALRLAGVPDDYAIWSGSCPCTPFSLSGRRKGLGDSRHLWPEMFRLVRECRPASVVGEQVCSAIAHGWLDLVFDELESIDYACGAVVLPACSVGARHIRQRLWWVADTTCSRCQDGQRRGSVGEFSWHRSAGGGPSQTRWHERWANQPGVGRVVHGVRPGNRSVRALGNAIVPELGARFIRAYFEAKEAQAQPQ